MFNCDRCGTCCRYHKCKYLTNNLCEIYENRPQRCNVEKMYKDTGGDMSEEQYYKVVKLACHLLKTKESIDTLIPNLFDSRFENERIEFRRNNA